MITEGIFSKFKNNILTEMIHLPHGIKSAKVVTHVDLDGAVSAISLINQLVKQGIPKERITLEFAQYGDDEKVKKLGKFEADKFQAKNKHQFVGVTDYAKYPKEKPWDLFNRLMGFHGNKVAFVKFMNSRDWSKIANKEDFKSILEKTFKVEQNKFTDKTVETLYRTLKAYSEWGKKDEGEATVGNIEKMSIALAKPDFGSDHHSNEQGALSAAKRGDLAAESPSEAELFADKYSPGLWGKDDIKAVSMVDSAGYSEDELKNTVFLEKHFTGPNKKRNLATIISVIYDNLVKKDERVAKWIILNSQPSLVSLYTTLVKGLKFNGERLKMLEAVKNGDYKTGEEIANALPVILKKNWTDKTGPNYRDRNGTEIKPANDLEGWRKKNSKDLSNALTGRKSERDEKKLEELKGKRDVVSKEIRDGIKNKKGKMFIYNNFTFFDGGDKRTQYTRYATSLYSVNGSRSPYVLRYWSPSMFQVAINTIYSHALKGQKLVDFSVVNTHVLEDLKNFLIKNGINSFSANKVIEAMKEKNGGHSTAIWTFSGFENIKAPSKEIGGDEYWEKRDMIKRANNLKDKKAEDVVPNAVSYVKDKDDTVGAKYKKIRDEAFKLAMNSAVYWTNKLYPPKEEGLAALKNGDSRFEGK